MKKCSNCSSEADYVFMSAIVDPQYFCKPCVPWGLRPRMASSVYYKGPVPAPAEIEEVIEKVVEEPVVEEPVLETPKPVKKKTKAAKTLNTEVAETDEYTDS